MLIWTACFLSGREGFVDLFSLLEGGLSLILELYICST